MSRIRVVRDDPIEDSCFVYEGVQRSPLTYEVDGVQVRLFSDREVYEGMRDLLDDSLDAHVERLLGHEPTSHHPSVRSSYEPSETLSRIVMTRESYDRAVECAQAIGELYSPVPEISLHLLRHREAPEGVITDVVPAMDQVVTPSSCSSTNYLGLRYGDASRHYAGWSHSHGSMRTFHSGVDDRSVLRRLPKEGLDLVVDDLPLGIKYLPSVVVNARGDEPCGVLGIRYRSHRSGEYRSELRRVPVEFVDESYGVTLLDLERFFREHVRVEGCREHR